VNHIIARFVAHTLTTHMPQAPESMRLGDMAKGEPVPEGVYHARVGSMEQRTTEPSEKNPDPWPYLMVSYIIMGGSPEEFHGRRVFDMLTLDPKNNFKLRQLAVAVFGEDEELDVMEKIRENAFIDAELQLATTVDKAGKGKDGKYYEARNRVSKVLALTA
jgi:hypothetical protein